MTKTFYFPPVKCPKCKGHLKEAGELNMMFPLNVGTGAEVKKGFLTAETAQGAYLNFKLEFEALRKIQPSGYKTCHQLHTLTRIIC